MWAVLIGASDLASTIFVVESQRRWANGLRDGKRA